MYNFTPRASAMYFYNDFKAWRRKRKSERDAMHAEAALEEIERPETDAVLNAYYLAQDLGFSEEDAMKMASNPEERRLFE